MPLVESAREYCMDLLQYCEKYPYHNPSHTTEVLDRATYLAMNEGVSGEDFEDLQLACVFHDTGFTMQYEKNEYFGAQIAREWLMGKKHPKARIEKIEQMIMATVLFSRPKTHLEYIIQDADLDNIGTKDEFYYSQRLLKEIQTIGKVEISDCAFWQFVYTLLTRYKFHTKTAKKERHEQQIRDIDHMEKFLKMIGCEVPIIEKNSMHQV